MLEFVFFDARPRQRFVDFLAAHDVACELSVGDDSLGVAIDEDIDNGLLATIEAYYDEMMALDQALFEAGEASAGHQAAGVVVNLSSGERVYARVDQHLLARVMGVLTPEELGELVNAIVDAVENPDTRPLCKAMDRPADGEGGGR